MKTSELEGAALDWMVAECEGKARDIVEPGAEMWFYDANAGTERHYWPTTDWAQGGPIIEREKIDLSYEDGLGWGAYAYGCSSDKDMEYGPTPLIAAMRCYVASKLGDDVDIPEGL